jgi:hypothetical protein
MADHRSIRLAAHQRANVMTSAKQRRRVAEANIAEKVHPRVTIAELGQQAPFAGDEKLERRPAAVGERRQHSLDSTKQAAVRHVQDRHRI